MQVTYELTQRDFYEALIAHRNRTAAKKWSRRLLALVVLLALVLCLVLFAVHANSATASSLTPALVVGVVWLALLRALPWWVARTQFTKQPAAKGLRTMVLDGTGVHLSWEAGNSDTGWRNYTFRLEGRNQFLLYSSPTSFAIIPKRALTPEQIAEFRALLAEHIGGGRR
jgi:hypothetical protein